MWYTVHFSVCSRIPYQFCGNPKTVSQISHKSLGHKYEFALGRICRHVARDHKETSTDTLNQHYKWAETHVDRDTHKGTYRTEHDKHSDPTHRQRITGETFNRYNGRQLIWQPLANIFHTHQQENNTTQRGSKKIVIICSSIQSIHICLINHLFPSLRQVQKSVANLVLNNHSSGHSLISRHLHSFTFHACLLAFK